MSNNILKIATSERKILLDFSDFGELPLIFLSLDFKILDFNKTAEQLFQWKRKEIINKCYRKWCKENNIMPAISHDNMQQLKNKVPIFDIENDIHNGECVLQWKIIPNVDEEDTVKEVIFIGTNITYKKSFENQMKNLAAVSKKLIGYDIGSHRLADDYVYSVYSYFEKIISCLPCIVFWKDRNFVYVNCNELSVGLMNKKSREEIIGKTDFDLGINIETANEIRRIDEEIVQTKLPRYDDEHHLQMADGRKYVYLLSKVPILDEHGEVIAIAGIMVDITEQKKTEKELIKSKEEAEAANKLKTEFVRNLEHDIRTPFSGILGMTKILFKMEKDPNKRQIIKDITSCTQELLDYCSSVLNFSKVESGAFPVSGKKFDLQLLLNRIATLETPVAKLKNIQFSIQCEPDVPHGLIGDSYKLERILINLVSNALKFTKNGYVQVLVKKVKKINSEDIYIAFTVEDSGIGIIKDKLEMIFEKFYRISPAHQGEYKGHGLGLHIVKQFVQEMGGEINVESELGRGSRFMCTLPFKLEPVFQPIDKAY